MGKATTTNKIRSCANCGERLSGGVRTKPGTDTIFDIKAYVIGIVEDMEQGLVIGHVLFPTAMGRKAQPVSFDAIAPLRFCPFCGKELGGGQ